MGKKFGKRSKKAQDPRDLFGPPAPRHGGPPASSTPLADYLNQGLPGVDGGYVVLPRSLAESMSLPWQQQLVGLLAQFHGAYRGVSWPTYRVVPSRYERLVDLDEEQLAEAGYLVEIDSEGEMVYRERSGRRVTDPANTTVLVSTLDPIVRGGRSAPPPAAPAPAVPINLPPAPVWKTVPTPPGGERVPPFPAPPPVADAAKEPPPAEPARAEPPPAEPPAPPPAAEPPPEPASTVTSSPPAPAEQPAETASGKLPLPPTARPVTDLDEPFAVPPTPPRGTPAASRGWFDELGENAQPKREGGFGPTGEESTEIPYRYRR
ncbi:hypothetical protein [Amycolatopsis suaedae]|uniref:Uncharacterized protein n=1 Tax=Amycolatopsis suaedae TaxID=2510978 RepID=A0A4Q7J6Q3_9PSEU|nr:hypothetical protein [Amycolatopsis suaedae]RZQ62578.1 hypothetical protein EWH70_16510 [Amycolatopsis suaedae]